MHSINCSFLHRISLAKIVKGKITSIHCCPTASVYKQKLTGEHYVSKDLIEILQNSPDAALNFVIGMPGLTHKIPAHLHITEIKQYAIASVDCGGKAHNWSETVIQIWAKSATNDGTGWPPVKL